MGRMSQKDIDYIIINSKKKTIEQIAKDLGRSEKLVEKYYVSREGGDIEEETVDSHYNSIRATKSWQLIKNEFFDEEIEFIEEQWNDLCSQFKDDIMPTEEIQMVQLIKFLVLMSRNLTEKKKLIEDCNLLTDMKNSILKTVNGSFSELDQKNKDIVVSFTEQINFIKSSQSKLSEEYSKLQDRHNTLMHSLKATRDQRLDKIEKGGVNFVDVIKMLMNKKIQKQEGRQMELMRIAGEKQLESFSESTKYADGTYDKPILSVNTVKE